MHVSPKTSVAPQGAPPDEPTPEASGGEFPDLAPALWRRGNPQVRAMLDGLKEHREVRAALERECGPLTPQEWERLAFFAGYRMAMEAKS